MTTLEWNTQRDRKMADNNDKLKELEQKIEQFKKQDAKPIIPQSQSSSLGMRVLTDLVSGLLVGGIIGYFSIRHLKLLHFFS